MLNRPTKGRGAVLITVTALILSAGMPALGGAETIVDSGNLFLGLPKSCDSPIDNCSRSRLDGAMKRYKFTAQEAIPDADDPNLVLLKGNSVIRMRGGGRLFSDDLVHVNTATGDVVHMWTITGGTGRFAGTTGSMAAGGNLASLPAGGPYVARLSVPDE